MNKTHDTLGVECRQQHCQACDFAADKLRILESLEQFGANGPTTRELMDRGAGMRPPNRVHDLMHGGVGIKTVAEGRGICRYILCKFLAEEKTKATSWEKLRGRPVTGLELWDAVRE
jgi:hypothetical protein